MTYLISYLSDQKTTGSADEEGSGAKGIRIFLMILIGLTILACGVMFFVKPANMDKPELIEDKDEHFTKEK